MEDSFKTKLQQNKYLLLAAAGLIVLLGILIYVGATRRNSDTPAASEPDTSTGTLQHDIDEEELAAITEEALEKPHVLLGDLSFMSKFVGATGATPALNILSNAILDYIGPAASGEYQGVVSGNTIVKTNSFPYSTLSFTIGITGGASYDVNIALVENRYFAMLISPYQPVAGTINQLTIVFLQTAIVSGYNRDEVISSLVNWAKSTVPGTISLSTEDLF